MGNEQKIAEIEGEIYKLALIESKIRRFLRRKPLTQKQSENAVEVLNKIDRFIISRQKQIRYFETHRPDRPVTFYSIEEA